MRDSASNSASAIHPLVSLLRVVPALYLADITFDLTVQILDAVGGLQAPAQLLKKAQPVERQGLLQSLHEATRRLPIDLLKLGLELQEPRLCPLVGRLLVRPLELLPPRGLVGLRQVAHHVLPFVPLAALHLGIPAKNVVDRLPEAFAAVNHAKQALLEREASFDQIAKQLLDRLRNAQSLPA